VPIKGLIRQEADNLNPAMIAMVACGCTFSASLVAIYIRSRLPQHHVEGDSKELIKLVMGLIATITALVLGLQISSAHSAYEAQEAELEQLSVHLSQVDWLLKHFGPDALETRDLLRRIVIADIERTWATNGGGAARYALQSTQRDSESLFEGIANLSPKTDLQRFGQSRALQLLGSIGETRRLMVEQAQSAVSIPFLVVLVSWLTILFFSFGLFASFNATVVSALFVGAASVAGAVFLILAMSQPYGGLMRISDAPLRDALTQIRQ
jgi:hypothetical protein